MLQFDLKSRKWHPDLRKKSGKDTLVYGSYTYLNIVESLSKTIFCKVRGMS